MLGKKHDKNIPDVGKDFDPREFHRPFYHHSRSLQCVDKVLTYSFSSFFSSSSHTLCKLFIPSETTVVVAR